MRLLSAFMHPARTLAAQTLSTRGLAVCAGTLLLLASACAGDAPTVDTGAPPTTTEVPALSALPLGDGKISTSARVGYVWSCQTQFGGNGAPPGSAPWISGTTWNATAKPLVQGSVSWPDARITIASDGTERVVSANNLPLHTTGTFPIQRSDPAYQYDGNPNPISAQTILLRLPLTPTDAAAPSCVPQGMIGFTTSGSALYTALDALGRDAAAHEVQDKCSGHPQGAGQYQYHSMSECIADPAGSAGRHSDLVGYAMDGYGIYGMRGENGVMLTNASLDVCHGHSHSVSWDGRTVVLYHYHMTREYPYSVGCYRGTPRAR